MKILGFTLSAVLLATVQASAGSLSQLPMINCSNKPMNARTLKIQADLIRVASSPNNSYGNNFILSEQNLYKVGAGESGVNATSVGVPCLDRPLALGVSLVCVTNSQSNYDVAYVVTYIGGSLTSSLQKTIYTDTSKNRVLEVKDLSEKLTCDTK